MKTFVRIIKNKYLLTAIVFTIWMIFFDQDNYFVQQERMDKLRESRQNLEFLTKEIQAMEQSHYDLTHNAARLETFAREHYKMKRENEDVYIIK